MCVGCLGLLFFVFIEPCAPWRGEHFLKSAFWRCRWALLPGSSLVLGASVLSGHARHRTGHNAAEVSFHATYWRRQAVALAAIRHHCVLERNVRFFYPSFLGFVSFPAAYSFFFLLWSVISTYGCAPPFPPTGPAQRAGHFAADWTSG